MNYLSLIFAVLLLSACEGNTTSTSTAATTTSGSASATASTTNTSPPSTSTNSENGTTTPQTGPSTPTTEPTGAEPTSTEDAARLLHQATFGPRMADIQAAQQQGIDLWLEAQIALPATLHRPLLKLHTDGESYRQVQRVEAWWRAALSAPDQLRQRTAFALSEIFVISDSDSALNRHPIGMTDYYDRLISHAFDNYRTLLEVVTLHPAMGRYLSHLGNRKADPDNNIRPDENYAREVLQLFSIGLVELNLDGSIRRDANGNAIATFTQETVENFARVFTGWTFADASNFERPDETATQLMQPWPAFHDTDAKVLLNNAQIPAGLSAQEDLSLALDNIFAHPNVGPFIGKQLIQRLVTSDPTPAYIERVASVFNDNGQGVRGDLGALVRAILTDIEARHGHKNLPQRFGKVKEPLIQMAHLWRVLEADSPSERIFTWNLNRDIGQGPLQASSVFNFFQPDYRIRTDSQTNPTQLAPELQIWTDSYNLNRLNLWMNRLVWSIYELKDDPNENTMLVHVTPWVTLLETQGIDALINQLNTVLFTDQLSVEAQALFKEALNEMSNQSPAQQIGNLFFLMASSPQYAVQQ